MKSQNQSSNILTRKWKQFWCLHLWNKGDVVNMFWPKGVEREFTCKVCGKKERWWNEFPISGILPPNPWTEYKKDPLYNVSPPIIRTED